jgi:hypothetical protein
MVKNYVGLFLAVFGAVALAFALKTGNDWIEVRKNFEVQMTNVIGILVQRHPEIIKTNNTPQETNNNE